MTIKLGLIGGGVMGEALLSRLLKQETYRAEEVMVSEISSSRRDYLAKAYGVITVDDNRSAAEAIDVLLLAVKPQALKDVTQQLIQPPVRVSGEQLILSIIAGVSIGKLEAIFAGQPVVRAMPNTPATVGAGMTAIAHGHLVTPHYLGLARRIFSAVGEVVEVPEKLMDAVTGLSGSGPGYTAVVIEALADGGVAAGLPRAVAQKLAIQTVYGTAKLLQESELHPAELKDRVTSPGGTTIVGVSALEQAGLRSALIQAVQAAYKRSQELGKTGE